MIHRGDVREIRRGVRGSSPAGRRWGGAEASGVTSHAPAKNPTSRPRHVRVVKIKL